MTLNQKFNHLKQMLWYFCLEDILAVEMNDYNEVVDSFYLYNRDSGECLCSAPYKVIEHYIRANVERHGGHLRKKKGGKWYYGSD